MSESVGYIYIGIFACRLPEELAKMHSNRDLNENVVKALPFFSSHFLLLILLTFFGKLRAYDVQLLCSGARCTVDASRESVGRTKKKPWRNGHCVNSIELAFARR